MSLTPTGREAVTTNGINRFSKDADNYPVVVSSSSEAVQDFGWTKVWQVAELKYARQKYEQLENNRLVRVQTDDCKDQRNA